MTINNSNTKRINVLYLSRWYPNRYDPMPGLFIQRHAEAANMYCKVAVVYVHAVSDKGQKKYELVPEKINGVTTIKVYYNNNVAGIPLVGRFVKMWRFYRANMLGIRSVKEYLGHFDLVHIHILSRLGLIGLYYKWFRNINYVISEHWSRYLKATGSFNGLFRKWFTRLVVGNAAAVTTVTANLAGAMRSHKLKNNNYIVLANVLSPDFINIKNNKPSGAAKKNIVHISCFEDKSKNISGILRVVKRLADMRDDFHIAMIGDGIDYMKMKEYAISLNIPSNILSFKGLLEGKELVTEMGNAALSLIFSNYENFPVVINESFSLGIAVISTRVGGIPEYVNDENGILLDAGDEEGLFIRLNMFLDDKYSFDSEKIKQKAISDFSMENVGKKLMDIYKRFADGP
ncbi:MAG: glycosyltransferase family 4 protein [Chlorobi bacterium]|nr:glycosyltransferase family 4 protein [Chlorobiota bacterium]